MRSAPAERGAVSGTGLRLALLGWVAASGTGCGYSLGYQAPPGARTAAVPIFLNATFPLRREIEFDLTSAFRQELLARTRLRLVDESASPDLVVRGRIVEFREGLVAEGRSDEKVESSVLATVELEVENYLDGTRRLVEPVRDVEPISTQSGEGFALGRRRAIRNLAERLVGRIEEWGAADPGEPPGAAGGGQGEGASSGGRG